MKLRRTAILSACLRNYFSPLTVPRGGLQQAACAWCILGNNTSLIGRERSAHLYLSISLLTRSCNQDSSQTQISVDWNLDPHKTVVNEPCAAYLGITLHQNILGSISLVWWSRYLGFLFLQTKNVICLLWRLHSSFASVCAGDSPVRWSSSQTETERLFQCCKLTANITMVLSITLITKDHL